MINSIEIVEKLRNKLVPDDRKIVDGILTDIQNSGHKSKKNVISDINKLIIDAALKNNKPSLLFALPDFTGDESDDLFARSLNQYIQTGDELWLDSIYALSEKLGKKSSQSRIAATMARDLIDAGVTAANPRFIDQGMRMLDRISFRKYRSEIMIDIIPLLIVWAITIRDEKLLRESLGNIEEICDISKRAVLHAEHAKAMATIAIFKKNSGLFSESILCAVAIHQKLRRHDCIFSIIEKGARSSFAKEIADLPHFTRGFMSVPHEALIDILSALTEQLMEHVKDKTRITAALKDLCETDPVTIVPIIINLLKKGEQSGEAWYLYQAIQLKKLLENTSEFPIREIVRAAVAIARSTNDTKILIDVIEVIRKSPNKIFLTRTYLQFAQEMLSYGDFKMALDVFSKIENRAEIISAYTDGLLDLLKKGIGDEKIPEINERLLKDLDADTVQNSISRATTEFCRDQSFEAIKTHSQSIFNLIHLHPEKDQLSFTCVGILAERGYLDGNDPGTLIKIANSITDQNTKEKALSGIVIKIAKIGVQRRNRDFLQRAVGLTCEIEGQKTRSITFSGIIDEASILAAQQGDLDLLLRMKDWSSSLIDKKSTSYAITNIIDGILKYAVDRRSPDALDQAHLIASEIEDPALKSQVFEKIAEQFVRVGCIIIKDPYDARNPDEFGKILYPFGRGLKIIQKNVKTPQMSLKIAGIIDIILSYYKQSPNPDFIIILSWFSLEIENPLERDAMMHRIISNIQDTIIFPDSTDPYEIISYILLKNVQAGSNPKIMGLMSRVLQGISNPYVKLSGLCTLADQLIRQGDVNCAGEILDKICNLVPQLRYESEKILILSDLTTLFCGLDRLTANNCITTAIKKLENIEPEKNSLACKRIVQSIVTLNDAAPKSDWIIIAQQVAEKIDSPVDYVHSLASIHRMLHTDPVGRKEVLTKMVQASEKIVSPYEKVTTLLEIVPLALADSTDDTPTILLKKAENLTKKINIQYIADTVRDNIAQALSVMHDKWKKKEYLSSAIAVAKSISDDELRLNRFELMGHGELYDVPLSFVKIKSLSEKMSEGSIHSTQIVQLERLVRSVADRGKEAVSFCDLAILFKKEGAVKLSRRMMQNAIREARIIRPLSRRAYVMCDIAMKMSAAGCERSAQEVLDLSIDAATNIRQSTLRDEVFDELGLAIKIIQEM